jgi:hypothetical protein
LPVPASAKQHAINWITGLLQNGPVKANDVKTRANAAGIKRRTLRRAAESIPVRYVRNADLSWSWAL